MNSSTQATLNRPALLHAREAHFARLEALYAGGAVGRPFTLRGITGKSEADPYGEPERWLDEALDDLANRAEESLDPLNFRPLVIEFGPYGVHFIDRMFGARIYRAEGQWWADHLTSPVGQLRPPDLMRDDTWLLARRFVEAFLCRNVRAPLFGLPTIASALNIAVNLYGEEFLMALHDRPEAAHHDLEIINDLLCALHHWYLAHIPRAQLQPVVAAERCQPRGYGQLCGCTTHLLSARMYEETVAPWDDALLRVYAQGGMIHLCGVHTQHNRVWRAMRSLRAVQLNDRAAEDLPIYWEALRHDQVIYLNPTENMTAERAIEITGGRRLVIIPARLPLAQPVR